MFQWENSFKYQTLSIISAIYVYLYIYIYNPYKIIIHEIYLFINNLQTAAYLRPR